ncbi:radical SAM protein [Micromonospora sp. IBSANI012]|uniref:radical SAM protein n=1 Tax=Micromonospora sp. IBSANI012 TaxID=3457761 RepID=UPI00405843DC
MRYTVAPLGDWQGLDRADLIQVARHHRMPAEGTDLLLLPHGRPGWLRVPSSVDALLPLLDGAEVGTLVDWSEFPQVADVVRALYDSGLLFIGGRSGMRAVPAAGDADPAGPPTSLLLKLTGACDMACGYCYDYDERRWPARMSTDLARRLITECLLPGRLLTLMFHGGEPMLRFTQIRELVAFATDRAARTGGSVRFSIQTNGLHLTRDAVEFFRAHRFTVGVSLDGPRPVNDRYRVDHAGRSTFDRITENFRVFPDFMRNEVGYISVVSHDTTREELDATWRYFRELGVRSWKLLPAEAEGRASDHRESAEFHRVFIDFLATRLDALLDGAEEEPLIVNLVQLIEPLVSLHRTNMCMKMPCGAAEDLLVLDATGGVRACDSSNHPVFQLLSGDQTAPRQRRSLPLVAVGGGRSAPAPEATPAVAEGESLVAAGRATGSARDLRDRERWLLTEAPCASCAWLHHCAGTCPARALIRNGSLRSVDDLECATRLELFPRILADVSRPRSRLRDYYRRAVDGCVAPTASGLG